MSLMMARGVRWTDVDDGIVILSPDAPSFVDLDAVGAGLWSLLIDSDLDPPRAIEWLVSEAQLLPGEAESAISRFVERLIFAGVLLESSGPGPAGGQHG